MASDASPSDVETVLVRAEKLLVEGQKLLSELQGAVRLTGMSPDGTFPIFYQDQVVHIALPWAAVDNLQMSFATRRGPADIVFFEQLLDFIPTLEEKAFLDVGSYTGTFAMFVRRFLKPVVTHMFEPQNVMIDALHKTISVNDDAKDVVLHQAIIDEDDVAHAIGAYRPDKLSEVKYLRRDGGKLQSRSIDSFGIENVGYINFDFPNSKINAVKGAMQTIRRDRPVMTFDMGARDVKELQVALEPLDYEAIRAGRNSMIFLPK